LFSYSVWQYNALPQKMQHVYPLKLWRKRALMPRCLALSTDAPYAGTAYFTWSINSSELY